jgi:hydrogenase expression/formation protein HypC
MRIIEHHDGWAWCESGLAAGLAGNGRHERVDLRLVGPVAPGDWALVFLGTARELMEPEQARQVLDALRALDAASRGESLDHLFADLIDREPQLPAHLRPNLGPASATLHAPNQEPRTP